MPRTRQTRAMAGRTGRQAVMLRQGNRAQPHGKRRADRYNTRREAIKEASQ